MTVQEAGTIPFMWTLQNDLSKLDRGDGVAARANVDGVQAGQGIAMLSEQAIGVAQNERWLVLLLGRLRPYDHDYNLEAPADWLLECIDSNPEGFYASIAGFFAFLLLDRQSGEVRLVSDHVGSVPLYLCVQDRQFWLSDSLKLLESTMPHVGQALSPQAIYDYCFNHCIPSPGVVYCGVEKLQPGGELRIGSDGKRQWRNLYRPDYRCSKASASALQARCLAVIEDAVRRNIAPDTGAFLSGGLDSSTVAGLFAKHQPGAPTFSIGFHAEGYDETEYARITARHFGTKHHEHYLQPAEITAHFATVASYFDEPFGNSSAMAAYVCARQAQQHGIGVLLAGDGGDEIFAGNERYVKQKTFELWNHVPGLLQQGLQRLVAGSLGSLPLLSKGRRYMEQARVPLPDRLDSYNFLCRFQPADIFEPDFLIRVDTEAPQEAKRARYGDCSAEDPVERMMYLDWKTTLADNDLVKVTRMCRMAGVEVRFPLFEKEVVDFSCAVPATVKLPGRKLRDFYKRSFRGFLPDETLSKSKHGFGLPFGIWMKEQPELRALTIRALEAMKLRGIFKADFVDTALGHHDSGHSGYYGELIWIMVVLELWLQSRGK